MNRSSSIFLIAIIAMTCSSMMQQGHAAFETFDLDGFGKLPVTDKGRVKPLSRYARNQLMLLSNKGKLKRPGMHGKTDRIKPIEWYLDVLAKPEKTSKDDVFRIDHPEVLGFLGLTNKYETGGHRKMFSISDLSGNFQKLDEEATRIRKIERDKRTRYENALGELYGRLQVYVGMSQMASPYLIPPDKEDPDAEWSNMAQQRMVARQRGVLEVHPAAVTYEKLLKAYKEDDPKTFNEVLGEYQKTIKSDFPQEVSRASLESLYRKIDPLFISLVLYVLCTLLLFVALLQVAFKKDAAGALTINVTFILATLSFLIHSGGLIARMIIERRPPVTTLYSSAIFVGWGAALVGVAMCLTSYFLTRWSQELKRLVQIFSLLLVGVIGFTTMIVANNQITPGEEDMEVMQAVLDTNFWLATHVVTITLGYAATYLAGLGGLIFIVLGLTTNLLTKDGKRMIGALIYGTTCFAVLLSLIGTVLGGIWADQSWGRFWGWDPKENGAVMIVIWTSLILHARWAGIVRERGLSVLAIVGNIVTAWSWFGTNQLGIGLHSYGFTSSATFYTVLFGLTQMFIMAPGLLPLKTWRSNQSDEEAARVPAIFKCLAYCNFAYGFVISLGLFVAFSMVDLTPGVVIYLLLAIVALAFLLYYSSEGLLSLNWLKGFAISHIAAIACLGHIFWLTFGRPGLWQQIGLQINDSEYANPLPKLTMAYGWTVIAMAYPVVLLLFVNLKSNFLSPIKPSEAGDQEPKGRVDAATA